MNDLMPIGQPLYGSTPTGLIKRFVLLRRKHGLSTDDFHAHWYDVLSPLTAPIPVVRRYVKVLTADSEAGAKA